MAKVHRFRSRQQRTERDVASAMAGQLQQLPDSLLEQLPGQDRLAISKLTHALHRHARPDTEEGLWPGGYAMLSRTQTKAVWDAIRALPADERPGHVRHAFDLVVLNLRQDTGEVMLTRDEIATEIGCSPDHVSHVMGTLERLDVIRRERRRIEGMRGPGVVVYIINPQVAWNGSLDIRKAEAAKRPRKGALRLVEKASEGAGKT